MSMKIADGKGSGKVAAVNDRQRLETSSSSSPRAYYVSKDDGQTYSWTSSYSAASGDEVIYIQNNDPDKNLYIDLVRVGGVNAGLFEMFEVSGTAAGTAITGKNLNLTSGNTATATAKGNAAVTGITIGDRIAIVRCAAAASQQVVFENALILGYTDAIAITYTGSTGIADVSIRGFFE